MAAPVSQETARRILSVSRSARLLIGRNDLLATAGYTVHSPKEPLDALVLLAEGPYLAVLVGDSVPSYEGKQIAGKAHELHMPVVFMHEGPAEIPGWADLAMDNEKLDQLLSFLEQQTYHST